MNKTTQRFPVDPDHIAAMKAAESAMQGVCLAFRAANPKHRGDFKLDVSVEMVTDYDNWIAETATYGVKTEVKYSVGTWGYAEKGSGPTFEKALEDMHQKTDADKHRERAQSLRREADRIEAQAAELEGVKSR